MRKIKRKLRKLSRKNKIYKLRLKKLVKLENRLKLENASPPKKVFPLLIK
nr:MAG TPA: hypothetical protein [Caudoviricetes sp.]DAV60223.1 MAG TPA: hypothetical protein [Caudoviricetes sp.]